MIGHGFSKEWDDTYREAKHLSIWPWSDLVSCVMRYAHPDDGFHRVLELGCGAGANIPLFMRLQADYWAVDGSRAAVDRLRAAYPPLSDRMAVGDFTSGLPFDGTFDLIVDRASVTHNATAAIRRSLKLAFDRLRPGGKYLGIDWFSTAHEDAGKGAPIDDHTRGEIPSRQFKGIGAVHFSDQTHLCELLNGVGFGIEFLEHKEITALLPEKARRASWNFVAVRPDPASKG